MFAYAQIILRKNCANVQLARMGIRMAHVIRSSIAIDLPDTLNAFLDEARNQRLNHPGFELTPRSSTLKSSRYALPYLADGGVVLLRHRAGDQSQRRQYMA
jgi:hypothetical protein